MDIQKFISRSFRVDKIAEKLQSSVKWSPATTSTSTTTSSRTICNLTPRPCCKSLFSLFFTPEVLIQQVWLCEVQIKKKFEHKKFVYKKVEYKEFQTEKAEPKKSINNSLFGKKFVFKKALFPRYIGVHMDRIRPRQGNARDRDLRMSTKFTLFNLFNFEGSYQGYSRLNNWQV